MCLANPAPDVFQPEDTDDSTVTNKDGSANQNTVYDSIKAPSRVHAVVHWIVVLIIVLLFLLSSVAVATNPELKRPLGGMLRRTVGYMRRIRNRYLRVRRTSEKGPLDIEPNRNELRNLQRGARRHLKALRANLD